MFCRVAKNFNSFGSTSYFLPIDENSALLVRNPSSVVPPKQPTLFLPPPPLHPPPITSADAHHQLSTDETCDDDNIYCRIPAMSSDGTESYAPPNGYYDVDAERIYLYGGAAGSSVDRCSNVVAARHPQCAAVTKLGTASPKPVRKVFDAVRAYSPHAASEPEPCPPTPPQMKMIPTAVTVDRRVPYSDGESAIARRGHTMSPPSPAPCYAEMPAGDDSLHSGILDDEMLDAGDPQ